MLNKTVRGGFAISVGFVLPLHVDFDICLGKVKCAFASLNHLLAHAKCPSINWYTSCESPLRQIGTTLLDCFG